MDIYLSINNREDIIKFPVNVEELQISTGVNNNTYDTISYGQIEMIGLPKLTTISISSFFPSKEYAFLKDKSLMGIQYVNKILAWQKRRLPVRLVITEYNINMPCSITEFTYSKKDNTGDIAFSLNLTEFKFI